MVIFLVFFGVAVLLLTLRLAPRLLRRHPPIVNSGKIVLNKRTVEADPKLGNLVDRYQLLLEDEDGRQVWTWCEAQAFVSAERGDTYARNEVIRRRPAKQ